MANLSNINNILRVSSSGVGLNKNNTGPSELDIESAGADMIDMTRTGQKTYRFAISGSSAFSIFDVAANDDRLVINSAGNATFAGSVTAQDMRLQASGTTYLNIGNDSTGSASTDGASIGYFTGQTSLQIVQRENDAMIFSTNSDEKMRIDSSGNVTIGSSTLTGPRSLTLLSATNATNYDINFQQVGTTNFGRIRFTEGAADFQFFAQVGQDPNLTLQYGGNSFFSRGNVGIGTDSPVSKLEVDGSIKVTGITSNIGADAGLSLSYDSGINYINTWASTPLITSTYNYQAFHISGSEKMRIHTNGNVGIGTTSPNAKLEVVGTSYLRGDTYTDRLLPYSGQQLTLLSGGANTLFVNGSVGIGTTSPQGKLDVAADSSTASAIKTLVLGGGTSVNGNGQYIQFRSSSNATLGSRIEGTRTGAGAASDLKFYTTSGSSVVTERMRITSLGQIKATPSTSSRAFFSTQDPGNFSIAYTAWMANASTKVLDVLWYGSTIGSISVNAGGTGVNFNTTSSDERLKKNITKWDENILDKFKDIKPKEFNFNTQEDTEEKIKGYIAQNEVDKFPEAYPLVYNEDAKEDRHLFNPSGMTVYLMKAIQELKADNDSLRARIETLENK